MRKSGCQKKKSIGSRDLDGDSEMRSNRLVALSSAALYERRTPAVDMRVTHVRLLPRSTTFSPSEGGAY
ncbi:unnamed protein product [Strongylus vulgaris]|uniref:Uncharacterized protein n=1 Tax=Strongylus vulgaris TaxID=40348 RepID=A0A3P7JX15_STRVU|nr:unnamed protein product [Strongylus vulgaris]